MALSHSPKIVTDGLVLCVDAGDRKSYPGSGSTWTDRSGGGYNTSLSNTTFDSGNGGSIVFDGADTYGAFTYSSDFDMDVSSTIEVIFRCDSALTDSSNARQSIFSHTGASSFGLELGCFDGCSITDGTVGYRFLMHRQNSCFSAVSEPNAWTQSEICHFVYTRGASREEKMYVNGLEITPQQTNNYAYAGGSSSCYLGVRQGSSGGQRLNGDIYNLKLYTKTLTADEVLQNFNAIRGRFGI